MERIFNALMVQTAVAQAPAVNPVVVQFQTTAAAEITVDIQWIIEV